MVKYNNLSYRDNVARVVIESGVYFRYIFEEYQEEYDFLISSGLYKTLVDKELLISHNEVTHEINFQDGLTKKNVYKKIIPEQIYFQAFPYEWTFTQWKNAIETFFEINKIALEKGMILKDATPHNFCFINGKLKLIDTSSFSFFKKGDPWISYRQFCSEFLSPIYLMYYNGQLWSRLTSSKINGFPLNFISKNLPIRSWFNMSCLIHIHFHSIFIKNESKSILKNSNYHNGFTIEKLDVLLKSIQNNIKKLKNVHSTNYSWLEYYERDIEEKKYLNNKFELLDQWLDDLQPESVIDIGANTGKFSLQASTKSKYVIALEEDENCLDKIVELAKKENIKNIFIIKNDLAEPTPSLGALLEEKSSIFNRVNCSLVLALAIVHHLYIVNKLTFAQITEIFARLCKKYLIVEFVPIHDAKVKILMRDRNISTNDYDEITFLKILSQQFEIKEVIRIENSDRKLILAKKYEFS